MQDTDRARYYEEHRGDDTLWGEAEQEDAPSRAGRTATITVRFSEAEAEGIRRIAKTAHTTYSNVVRDAVRSYVEPRLSITQTTHNQFWSGGPPRTVGALIEDKVIVLDVPSHLPPTASSATRIPR